MPALTQWGFVSRPVSPAGWFPGTQHPRHATEGLPPIDELVLQAARERIFTALKAHDIAILHSSNVDNVEALIDWGVMVTHGTSEEHTTRGRTFTNRQMPY